jgi:hypothetical protein
MLDPGSAWCHADQHDCFRFRSNFLKDGFAEGVRILAVCKDGSTRPVRQAASKTITW